MRYAVLLVVLLSGACKKSQPAPEATPEPVTVGSAAPTPAPPPVADTPADQKLREEILTYTVSMIPLLASWDGDCIKQIERMKKLEPLVQQIRDDETKVADGFDERIKNYMQAHKAEVVGKMQAAVTATKLTQQQIAVKETEIKAKCTGADYAEEMNRIGVMKKKTP